MTLQIKFGKNWNNKLECDYFTTIRLLTKDKALYYNENRGLAFNVMLKDEKHSEAVLVGLDALRLKDIPEWLIATDAALDVTQFKRLMYRMYHGKKEWFGELTQMLILIFKKVK